MQIAFSRTISIQYDSRDPSNFYLKTITEKYNRYDLKGNAIGTMEIITSTDAPFKKLFRMTELTMNDLDRLIAKEIVSITTGNLVNGDAVRQVKQQALKLVYDKQGNIIVDIVSEIDSKTAGLTTVTKTAYYRNKLGQMTRKEVTITTRGYTDGQLPIDNVTQTTENIYYDEYGRKARVTSTQTSNINNLVARSDTCYIYDHLGNVERQETFSHTSGSALMVGGGVVLDIIVKIVNVN